MWYNRKTMRSLMLIGASLSLAGAMLAVRGHGLLGTLVFAVGISAVVMGFAVIRFHARYEWETRRRLR